MGVRKHTEKMKLGKTEIPDKESFFPSRSIGSSCLFMIYLLMSILLIQIHFTRRPTLQLKLQYLIAIIFSHFL